MSSIVANIEIFQALSRYIATAFVLLTTKRAKMLDRTYQRFDFLSLFIAFHLASVSAGHSLLFKLRNGGSESLFSRFLSFSFQENDR